MSVNATKQGIFNTGVISEYPAIACSYDTNLYTEPDGSKWIRIFHHNNPASKKFASTDTFTTSVYTDADRWFYVSLCDKIVNSTYELMIKQKSTSSDTEAKYRWIQFVNPMTAVYDDVVVANVIKNTNTGYSTHSNYGGIYKENNHSYIIANNGKTNNWYGAIGSWTDYNTGIPGYAAVGISTGYMDLYLRIDNKPSMTKSTLYGNYFYEK